MYCAKLINEIDPLGVIGIDCGIGKDGAGIAGLWYFEALGTPAAAVDVMTVELGNGRDLWTNGVISRINSVAESLGVRAGMLASEKPRTCCVLPTSPNLPTRQDGTWSHTAPTVALSWR